MRVPVSPMCSPVGMDAPASSPAPPHRRPCRFTGRPPSVDPDRTICACGRSPRHGGRSLLRSYGEPAEAFGGLFCVCHPCPGASSPSATDTCAVTGKDGRSGALYPPAGPPAADRGTGLTGFLLSQAIPSVSGAKEARCPHRLRASHLSMEIPAAAWENADRAAVQDVPTLTLPSVPRQGREPCRATPRYYAEHLRRAPPYSAPSGGSASVVSHRSVKGPRCLHGRRAFARGERPSPGCKPRGASLHVHVEAVVGHARSLVWTSCTPVGPRVVSGESSCSRRLRRYGQTSDRGNA